MEMNFFTNNHAFKIFLLGFANLDQTFWVFVLKGYFHTHQL